MARTRTISSIETEINKVEVDLVKAKKRCDALSAKLLELQEQKQAAEAKQVMNAFCKSGKTMQELMAFLDV